MNIDFHLYTTRDGMWCVRVQAAKLGTVYTEAYLRPEGALKAADEICWRAGLYDVFYAPEPKNEGRRTHCCGIRLEGERCPKCHTYYD